MMKKTVTCHKPMILFLQESKLSTFDSRIISSLGGRLMSKGIGVDSIGATGERNGSVHKNLSGISTPSSSKLRWSISIYKALVSLGLTVVKGRIGLEESEWRQKSRNSWLVESDKNNRYFHNVVNARQRHNFLRDITYDGVILSSSHDIREGTVAYFKNHFKNVEWNRPKIRNLNCKRILVYECKRLEEEFGEEEVWEALKGCDGNKAPGVQMASTLILLRRIRRSLRGIF
ncbi:hypothetical protein Ddye_032256 [Dipteronia dyeriana]|uniref:Uncharacterized protein n=1 Tax=Dipteronia dyeriana TaxID=168575 RepID=A0AAD9TJV3_9ROSI|nr:hypothetical protein Ddye_032256 [Dipteronia dyeriana]